MLLHGLNRYITLEIATQGKDGQGAPIETYQEYKKTWSGIQYTGGRTEQNTYGEIAKTDAIFTIRYDKNISYKHRIVYKSQTYRITHIEIMGRDEGLRLRCIMWIDE